MDRAHPILIVDDDPDIRDSLSDFLELEGYHAVVAENGQSALQQLRKESPPCVILLDLMMPVMNGLEFRQEQLKDPALANIPVVVITAGGSLRAAPLNVPLVTKPLNLDRLLSMIRQYCVMSADPA